MPARFPFSAILASMTLLSCGIVGSSAAPPDPLRAYRWTQRVLVISAATGSEPLLAEQRRAFAAMQTGARERDLVLVEAVGDDRLAQAIRARLNLDPSRFAVALVGKDGGVKLKSTTVLDQPRLFSLIDAMPMRQQEMQR